VARGFVNRSKPLAETTCQTCGGYLDGHGHERDGSQLCWCPEPEPELPPLPRPTGQVDQIAKDVAETLKYERHD
jgi:hypothetical protein